MNFKRSILAYPNDSISTDQVIDDHNDHSDHDDIHRIPVRIPINFDHPFPKIQVKSDPNANTKSRQSQNEGQDVMDHHGPLEGSDSSLQDVFIIL